MELLAKAEENTAVILCDRGTIDGLAYGPGSARSFFQDLITEKAEEFGRYATMIHVETPPAASYTTNHIRHESPRQAHEIDGAIRQCWEGHPNRFVIPSARKFLEKAAIAIEVIRNQVPPCCRTHAHPELENLKNKVE